MTRDSCADGRGRVRRRAAEVLAVIRDTDTVSVMANPLAAYLCPPGFAGPRGWRPLVAETSVVREAGHLVSRRVRRTAGSVLERDSPDIPVLLIPGFLAGDATLRPMAARLRAAGYRTYRSRIRANIGCSQVAGDALEHRLEAIAARRGRPVAVVGHSLGGLMAKALAHRRPELVSGIVTLASPLLAPGAVHPVLTLDLLMLNRLHGWGFAGLMSADCTRGGCARLSWEQLSAPTRDGFAFTSLYSHRDGIVDWRACLDPGATQVLVECSHVGMAVDPAAHDEVLAGLARITASPQRTARGRGRPADRARAATGGRRRVASR